MLFHTAWVFFLSRKYDAARAIPTHTGSCEGHPDFSGGLACPLVFDGRLSKTYQARRLSLSLPFKVLGTATGSFPFTTKLRQGLLTLGFLGAMTLEPNTKIEESSCFCSDGFPASLHVTESVCNPQTSRTECSCQSEASAFATD